MLGSCSSGKHVRMRKALRALALPMAALLLAAAEPDTFTREELNALETEKLAAERKLAVLESTGTEAMKDIGNIDAELIAAAMESQRREEQASDAEKSLIDLGTRRVAAQMRLLENQQALEDLIVTEHKRGATIVFSTHVMEHAERLCEKIVMMARGRKVFDGTLDEAFGALGKAVHIGTADGFDLAATLQPKGFPAVREGSEDGLWRVSLSGEQPRRYAAFVAAQPRHEGRYVVQLPE